MENNTPNHIPRKGSHGTDRARYLLEQKLAKQIVAEEELSSDFDTHDEDHDHHGTRPMPGLEDMVTPDWDMQ